MPVSSLASPAEMAQLSSGGTAAKLAADTMSAKGGKLPVAGKSGKGIHISPNIPCSASSKSFPTKLLGPHQMVPLLLECFETAGYPCGMVRRCF
jgi:hypothetical protein